LAGAANVKVETRWNIKRGNPPPGIPAPATEQIFKTPQDSAGATEGAAPTERLVFRVTDIKVPPLDPQAEDAKRIDDALKSRTSEDLIAQYIAHLESEVGVTINQGALSQVTGNGPQN
jgi:peptidyl-prolyl cis-trans isomerase D